MFLEKLRAVIEDTSTLKGKIFDYFIQVLCQKQEKLKLKKLKINNNLKTKYNITT